MKLLFTIICAAALWIVFGVLAVYCWMASKIFAVIMLIIMIAIVGLMVWLADPIRNW